MTLETENQNAETTPSAEAGQVVEAKEFSDSDIMGKIVEGTVTHITSFGAFIKLDMGEEGLVHISEIANEYVTDINNFVTIGEKVKIKILARNKKGKLDLSLKKASSSDEKPALFIRQKSKNDDFESKVSDFLKRSEEKQIDIRRNLKQKQGIVKKKR